MTLRGLQLVLPEKTDSERDAVERTWLAAGGSSVRLGRFWDPPALDPAVVRLYGHDTFAALDGAAALLASAAAHARVPATCVLDVGLIDGRGWAVIEANAAWGAGLNGCRPERILGCLARATTPPA